MTKHYLIHSLLVCALLLLTACGTPDSTETPETPSNEAIVGFEEQEVVWEACDPSIFLEDWRELLATLGDRLECATLSTPLDWGEPELDTINLGVLRVRAGNDAERKGAIFLNPGGPGGDGLEVGAIFGLIFASSDLASEITAASDLLTQVSEQYDVIGFSPRGVGGSFQLFCGSNEQYVDANFYTDRSDENVQALLAGAKQEADACLNTPLYKHISTEQTARDMDLIRQVLGDDKLNYLGYSYGTWLGSWYAKLFPEHAGNMVLDANLDFSAGWPEAEQLDFLGFQRAFEDVALAYAARNDALFELGATQEEVYAVYEGLPTEMKEALNDIGLISTLYSSQRVQETAASLIAAEGVSTVLSSLETSPSPDAPETYGAFLEAVAAYTYVSDEALNEEVVNLAVSLAEVYLFYLDPPPEPITLLPGHAVLHAVHCNESDYNNDPNYWIQQGDQLNQQYPLLGGRITFQVCAYWDEPNAQMPDVPENIPPVLMVQTGFDAATAVEGARRGFESLPNAKLIYVENEMTHAIFPYNTPCVDEKVAAYLLDGTLPEEDISSCDAKPLPGEDQVYPPGGVPSFGTQSLSTQAAETFEPNPLYDLVHEMIRENAADFFGH